MRGEGGGKLGGEVANYCDRRAWMLGDECPALLALPLCNLDSSILFQRAISERLHPPNGIPSTSIVLAIPVRRLAHVVARRG